MYKPPNRKDLPNTCDAFACRAAINVPFQAPAQLFGQRPFPAPIAPQLPTVVGFS